MDFQDIPNKKDNNERKKKDPEGSFLLQPVFQGRALASSGVAGHTALCPRHSKLVLGEHLAVLAPSLIRLVGSGVVAACCHACGDGCLPALPHGEPEGPRHYRCELQRVPGEYVKACLSDVFHDVSPFTSLLIVIYYLVMP